MVSFRKIRKKFRRNRTDHPSTKRNKNDEVITEQTEKNLRESESKSKSVPAKHNDQVEDDIPYFEKLRNARPKTPYDDLVLNRCLYVMVDKPQHVRLSMSTTAVDPDLQPSDKTRPTRKLRVPILHQLMQWAPSDPTEETSADPQPNSVPREQSDIVTHDPTPFSDSSTHSSTYTHTHSTSHPPVYSSPLKTYKVPLAFLPAIKLFFPPPPSYATIPGLSSVFKLWFCRSTNTMKLTHPPCSTTINPFFLISNIKLRFSPCSYILSPPILPPPNALTTTANSSTTDLAITSPILPTSITSTTTATIPIASSTTASPSAISITAPTLIAQHSLIPSSSHSITVDHNLSPSQQRDSENESISYFFSSTSSFPPIKRICASPDLPSSQPPDPKPPDTEAVNVPSPPSHAPITSSGACFGVDLDSPQPQLMLDPTDVHGQGVWLPRVFVECVRELRQNLQSPGIFRKAGSVTRQRTIRISLEAGQSLTTPNVHDVASILKQYLRELPSPLVPPSLSPLLKEVWSCDKEGKEKVEMVMCALLRLPQPHLQMLRQLCSLLHSVAAEEATSLMDSRSLAVVMTPNIIRTHHSDPTLLQTALKTNTGIVQLLIDHAHLIGLAPPHVISHAHQLAELDSTNEETAAASSNDSLEGRLEEVKGEGKRDKQRRSSITGRVLGWGSKLMSTIGSVSRDLGIRSRDQDHAHTPNCRHEDGLQLGNRDETTERFDPSLPPRPHLARTPRDHRHRFSFIGKRRRSRHSQL